MWNLWEVLKLIGWIWHTHTHTHTQHQNQNILLMASCLLRSNYEFRAESLTVFSHPHLFGISTNILHWSHKTSLTAWIARLVLQLLFVLGFYKWRPLCFQRLLSVLSILFFLCSFITYFPCSFLSPFIPFFILPSNFPIFFLLSLITLFPCLLNFVHLALLPSFYRTFLFSFISSFLLSFVLHLFFFHLPSYSISFNISFRSSLIHFYFPSIHLFYPSFHTSFPLSIIIFFLRFIYFGCLVTL